MPTFAATDLQAAVAAVYRAAGVPKDEADIVARHQLDANLVGHDSHGVILTAQYLRQIERGEIVPGAAIDIEQESPTTAVVNGNWGFGFVVTDQAVRLGLDKARSTGTAALTVRQQGHMGRLGFYATTIAAEGMIALVTADSGRGPKAVAPFGGRTARLGTNPVCFGIPSDLAGPVVLDMATSAVSVGKVALARDRGRSVPEGWFLDAEGRPGTDPAAFFRGGALLPLGGDQAHKGFGLSFIVEILCGLLTGLGHGVAADGRHNDGSFIGIFDVSRFRDLNVFKREVADFVDYIHESPRADGAGDILYPGEIEYRTRRHRDAHGIPIDPEIWSALGREMDRLGVPLPSELTP